MEIFIENPRPVEDKTLAIIILVLNIVPIPGIGTLIYNLQTKDDKWVNAILPIVFSTVLAFTVVFYVLGLVWAIIDGIKIYQTSEAARRPAAGPGTTATWTTTTEPATAETPTSTEAAADGDGPSRTEPTEKKAWEPVPAHEDAPETDEQRPRSP